MPFVRSVDVHGPLDSNRKGYLSWDSGEIQSFIARVRRSDDLQMSEG